MPQQATEAQGTTRPGGVASTPGPGIKGTEVQMHHERNGSPVTPVAIDGRLTWTIPEAAKLLGISKDSAYEAAHRGELPVKIIGRRMLVPRAALLRLLDGAEVERA